MATLAPPAKDGPSHAISVRIEHRDAPRAEGQRRHDLRLGAVPGYVDGERSPLNSVLVSPQTGPALRALCEERRAQRATQRAMKRNAAVASHLIVTFGAGAQPLFQALPVKRQDEAFSLIAEAVAERLGSSVTGLVVHRDEAAPHAHVQMPAVDEAGMPLSKVVTPTVAKELQDLAATWIAEFEPRIVRGRPKAERVRAGEDRAKTVHRSVRRLHQDLPDEIADLEAQAEALRGDVATLEGRVADLQGREDHSARREKRLRTYKERLRKKRDQLNDRASQVEHARTAAEALRKTAEEDNKAAAIERERLAALQTRLDGEAEELRAGRDRLAGEQRDWEDGRPAREAAIVTAEAAQARLDQADAREADLTTRETTARYIEGALGNLTNSIEEAVEGRHDVPITLEEVGRPRFDALQRHAPRLPVTRGFRARFWSLSFSDGSGPKPLPRDTRARLRAAFDAVDRLAKAIARARRIEAREAAILDGARTRATALVEDYEQRRDAALETLERDPELRRRRTFQRLMNDTLRAMLPEDTFRRCAAAVNAAWAQHPDNTAHGQEIEPPPPPPSHEGPSGP